MVIKNKIKNDYLIQTKDLKKMSKKARSEGNKVASLIKSNKTEYYIADVDLEDDTDDVKIALDLTVKTLGKYKSAFMLISAGVKCLTVVVHVPDCYDKINSQDWINESVKNITGERIMDKNFIVITTDTPFKLKDTVRANGFAYLKKHKCMDNDDESSEEFVGFDDL